MGDKFIGVKLGQVFILAKEFIDLDNSEIEKLMENEIHEVRAGAMSIIGQNGKSKKVSEQRIKELYVLYLKRHDRINNWDLVDLAAYYLVGRYLNDKPRDVLYKLAKSKNMWERRTAIVATAHFMGHKDFTNTYKIAEMLLDEKEELVQKGAGWMLRIASDGDRTGFIDFIQKHAAKMPRIMLRYSIEKLSKEEKQKYMKMKGGGENE